MTKRKRTCKAVLTNDSGSDYRCTEPKGHTDDHTDALHPFSWPQGATRMTQGRIIIEKVKR